MLEEKFSEVTDHTGHMGLSDLANYDQFGNWESEISFPFSLEFEPSSYVKNLFPTNLSGNDPLIFTEQLESIPSDSSLY